MNIFDQMIDIIEERGLGKGVLVDPQGRCCLLGARYLVDNPNHTYDKEIGGMYSELDRNPEVEKMALFIRPNWESEFKTIPVFNFSDKSTQQEVIDFLKRMSEKENV